MRTLRAALVCFALGALLLAGKSAASSLLPEAAPIVEVVVPCGASEEEIATRVEEAILVEEGLRFGWAESDPVIRRRLAMNMAFASGEPASDEEERVEAALALGMQRTDPVVRGRLVARVRALLADPGADEPDEAALAAHLDANPARFAVDDRLELVHVVVRAAQASAMLARLESGAVAIDDAPSLGERIPLLPARQHASAALLERRFGSGFGQAVAALPAGRWAGPVRSSYGVHLVFVSRREDGEVPPLEAIRDAVRRDYLARTSTRRVGARLAALRARYVIRVVEVAPS